MFYLRKFSRLTEMPLANHAGGISCILHGLGDGDLVLRQTRGRPREEDSLLAVHSGTDWKTTWYMERKRIAL